MRYADSLGFLGFPGQPISVQEGLKLDLVNLTSAPPWRESMGEVLADHEAFKAQIAAEPRLQLVRDVVSLDDALASGKTAVVLGLQNAPRGSDFDQFAAAGVRFVSLAYHGLNSVGGGWAYPEAELDPYEGLQAFEEAADAKMTIDLSHLGHRTARDILKLQRQFSVAASHGGCFGAYHHIRNLPDDVLRGIAERGGYVGIATLTFLLDERDDSMEPFVRHVRHALDICGTEAVGLGTDGYYVHVDGATARERFASLKAKLDANGLQGARYPEHPYMFQGPDRMVRIERALDRLPADIREKVLGLNFLAFLRRSL